jgi:hypothetical protein
MQQDLVDRDNEYLHQVSDLIAPDFSPERWSRGGYVGERRDAIMTARLVLKSPPPLTIIIHFILKYRWDVDQRPVFG